MMADRRLDDTWPTEEDGLLDQLRADGILGPFAVTDWAASTDIGLRRPVNEDAWGSDGRTVFVVADGIGGHEGGRLAALSAVDAALVDAVGMSEASAGDVAARVNGAVVRAGAAAGIPDLGTTLVVLVVHRHHVTVLSVGDSRVYRLRDGEVELLTRDHSVRNELIASGVPFERATELNIRLDALTSFIGRMTAHPVACHIASYSIMDGDRFLMSTDGLHGQVEMTSIESMLSLPSCEDSAQALVAAARDAGGHDNATAVVMQFAREPVE